MSRGALHLDFLQAHRSAARWGLWLALAGLLAMTGVVAWYTQELEPQLQSASAALSRAQREAQAKAPPPGPRMDDKRLDEEWAQAAKVAEQLNAPWAELLDMLEEGTELQVALLSLEPDLPKREFVLTGEARHYEALMGYYRYLQAQPQLTGVAVHMHQVSRQDRDRPLRFRVSGRWAGGDALASAMATGGTP